MRFKANLNISEKRVRVLALMPTRSAKLVASGREPLNQTNQRKAENIERRDAVKAHAPEK